MLMAKRYLCEKKIYMDNVIEVTEKVVCMRLAEVTSRCLLQSWLFCDFYQVFETQRL